jgi:hypothetical protein
MKRGDYPVMLQGLPLPTESDYFIGLTEEFPTLKRHKQVITSIPQIREWIKIRHQTIA